MATVHLSYEGPAAGVSMLAEMLRREGVEVDYEPPMEERGLGPDAHEVLVALVAAGAYDAIKEAVRKFTARFPHAKVDVPPDEADD